MLKPGDGPLTGAQVVAAMTNTQPSKSLDVELQELKANLQRNYRETQLALDRCLRLVGSAESTPGNMTPRKR